MWNAGNNGNIVLMQEMLFPGGCIYVVRVVFNQSKNVLNRHHVNTEHWWNDSYRRLPMNLEKNMPQCHFVHQKSYMN